MANLSLSALCINARGNKTATLLDGSQRLVQTFAQPARCLFGPSNFDKDESAARQGIPFELTQEMSEFFTKLDVWAKQYIEQESERLLGKPLTKEQVEQGYVSCVKESPGKPPLLKLKINMAHSAKPCRAWHPDGSEAPWPQDWALPFQIRIKVSHLWMMGGAPRAEFGFVCLLEDAMPQRVGACVPLRKTLIRLIENHYV